MHGKRILGAALAGALLALSPGVASATGATAKQWTVTLPESVGVQAVAADSNHAYTAWGDPDPGHVGAFSRLSGALRWRKAAPDFAALLAVGRNVVWSSDGGTAEAERASNGARVTTVSAPAEEGFQTIAATGSTLAALSDGPSHQVLSEYNTAGKLTGRHTTSIPSTSVCQETLGGGALFALCLATTAESNWTLYRVSLGTGRTQASRAMPASTDGGASLVYAGSHLYVLVATGAGGSNTTPAHIIQYQPATLKITGRSPVLNLISIAASGQSVAGVQIDSKAHPTKVNVFSARTVKVTRTVAVHTAATLMFFAADATDAFLVVFPPHGSTGTEQLTGLPLG